MPTYEFSCEDCGRFNGVFAMAEVPSATMCPQCRAPAQRLVSNPAFVTSSSAKRLVEATERSAHEPAVVQGSPPAAGAPAPRVTHNPLHAKLPRP